MKRLVPVLGLLALAVVLVACSGGGGASNDPGVSADPNAVKISANNMKFSTDTLTAKADTAFQIAFDNQEAAPHNVAIYKDAGFGEKAFGSDPFGGPKTVTYSVPALAAGTYYFRCDVHPDMKGTVEVQ